MSQGNRPAQLLRAVNAAERYLALVTPVEPAVSGDEIAAQKSIINEMLKNDEVRPELRARARRIANGTWAVLPPQQAPSPERIASASEALIAAVRHPAVLAQLRTAQRSGADLGRALKAVTDIDVIRAIRSTSPGGEIWDSAVAIADRERQQATEYLTEVLVVNVGVVLGVVDAEAAREARAMQISDLVLLAKDFRASQKDSAQLQLLFLADFAAGVGGKTAGLTRLTDNKELKLNSRDVVRWFRSKEAAARDEMQAMGLRLEELDSIADAMSEEVRGDRERMLSSIGLEALLGLQDRVVAVKSFLHEALRTQAAVINGHIPPEYADLRFETVLKAAAAEKEAWVDWLGSSDVGVASLMPLFELTRLSDLDCGTHMEDVISSPECAQFAASLSARIITTAKGRNVGGLSTSGE